MSSETSLNSTTLHLLTAPKNVTATAVMTSLLKHDDLVSTLLKDALKGLNVRMSIAHAYAKNTYTLGLPSGRTLEVNTPTKNEIASRIVEANSYDHSVIVYDFTQRVYSPYHEVLNYLVTEHSYNPLTNNVYRYNGLDFSNGQGMIIVGSSVSLDGLSINITYEYWGPVEDVSYDYNTGTSFTTYVNSLIGSYSENVIRPSTSNTKYSDGCLIASYSELDANGDTIPLVKYWIYRTETALYPNLNPYTQTLTQDEYLPVVPIRYNNTDMTQEGLKGTDLYKTSETLLGFLGLPFKDLGDQVNASPSKAEIDNAYVMFGADIQSNEPATLAYLNNYFDYLRTLNTTRYYADTSSSDDYFNSSLTEHGLSLRIWFTDITTTYIPGVIGATSVLNNARKTIEYVVHPATTSTDFSVGDGVIINHPEYRTTELILDLQVTRNTIRRVVVKDLVVENQIDGNNSLFNTVDRIKDDGSTHMIIPLEYNKTLELPPDLQTSLYTDCCLLVINSIKVTDLEWYEESWFLGVCMVVAIVITVVSFQEWALPWLVALFEAIIIADIAAIIYLSSLLLYLVLLEVAMTWVVNQIGPELSVIGAVALSVVALIVSGGTDVTIANKFILQSAQIVLQMSMVLVSAANEFIQVASDQITTDYLAATKIISDASEALSKNSELAFIRDIATFDALMVTKSKKYYSIPNEYPTEFFNRTLNLADNSLYVVHKAIPNFVSSMLVLDKNTVSLA